MTEKTGCTCRAQTPRNLRWVKAMATLAEQVFAVLADRVRNDCEDSKHVRSTKPLRHLEFQRTQPEAFFVAVSGPPDRQPIATVQFELKNLEQIEATTISTDRTAEKSVILGVPVLDRDGEISIQTTFEQVDGLLRQPEQLAPWQFSREVLEPLIFPHGHYPPTERTGTTGSNAS